ncbi:hypothetical protein B0T17DRAFT_241365 [Bombardia bombarda]|uniref:Uncharacterized protein n=1 Tax=Bombardia bombarda TaxID=252184 RepID=A0AA39XCH5_9PEZI|nr:hypothetical protein B0T17DRAFT_241365 [Bombardia bombarda]
MYYNAKTLVAWAAAAAAVLPVHALHIAVRPAYPAPEENHVQVHQDHQDAVASTIRVDRVNPTQRSSLHTAASLSGSLEPPNVKQPHENEPRNPQLVVELDPNTLPQALHNEPDLPAPTADIHIEPISPRDSLVNLTTLGVLEGPRVPTCARKPGKLHTQRQWTISYDEDDKYNGKRCGQSIKSAMRWHLLCHPLTDWTCVASGSPGYGGVTVQFHTPRTCSDKSIRSAVSKGTNGQVDVWCQHH